MKFKNNIRFLLILSTIMILSGCSKNETTTNVNGEVDVSETSSETTKDNDIENSMPVYDYKNLPVSNAPSTKEFDSYYKNLLNERDRICYDEIYNAAENYQDELVLSKSITPESLKHIMNIIYLDTPELYMLEPHYAYDTDTNGTVYKVYLKYCFEKEFRETFNEAFLSNTTMKISEFKNQETQYDLELAIAETLETTFYSNDIELDDFSGKNPENSILTPAMQYSGNSIAIAKLFNYYCRKSGLNSALLVGEIIDTNYAKNIELKLNDYKPLDEVYIETVDGSHIDVDVDYSGFYAWNIVELNDKWYHVDVPFYLQFFKTSGLESLSIENLRVLLNVDDYTISQSRLFFINEEILGLIPECNEKIFQTFYRQGDYILNYNDSQIATAMNVKLNELVETKPNEKIYQFGSEETYNLFVKKFDSIIKNYNENNGNVIQNYDIVENKAMLCIVLKNLLYY